MDMKVEKFDYEKVKEMLYSAFGAKMDMVFSTSYADDVTSRFVTPIRIGDKFYFLTSKESRKYPQLVKNPNTTLCGGKLYFKTKAKDIGSPSDEKNMEVAKAIKAEICMYDMLAGMPDAVFIELEILSGEISESSDTHYHIYAADFVKKEAVKVICF